MVDELGYSGFERLRRGFDRSFGGQDQVPQFELVIDAGCGTGLVGEQVGWIDLLVFLMMFSFLMLYFFSKVPQCKPISGRGRFESFNH